MNEHFPKVSIITATFNSARYLADTIQSVIAQTYPNIEYIVVDGASSDGTLDIIENYRAHISKMVSEPDHGIYDAFNKGMALATGEILYFLNSDDYLYDQNTIQEVAGVFAANPNCRFVYGNVLVLDEKVDYRYVRGKPFTLTDLRRGDMPPHPGFFVHRELVVQIGPFATQYSAFEDFDFVIRCFLAAEPQSSYLNRTIAVFRETGGCTDPEQMLRMNAIQTETVRKYFGAVDLPNLQVGEVYGLYKVWLENWLLRKQGISYYLHQLGVGRVGIFGTMKTALYLLHDLQQEGFEVVCFLDNNQQMQHRTQQGIPVFPEEWLQTHFEKLDAVILSLEGQHDQAIKERLKQMTPNWKGLILSWKDLARMSRER